MTQPAKPTHWLDENSPNGLMLPSLPQRIPAWLCSGVFHLVVLLVLGLAIRPSLPKSLPGPDRAGGIVLAQQSADRTEYLEPNADHEEASRATAPAETAELPPAEAAAGIELPMPAEATNAPGGVRVGEADGSATARPVIGASRPMNDAGPSGNIRKAPAFSGPVAKLSLFGSGFAEGNSFVFVIDRSKSMGSQGLGVIQQAKVELAQAMKPLGHRHKFQIVAYHHERHYLDRAGLLPANEDNKNRVIEFFDNLAAFGGTNHELALFAGLGMHADVIFFMTDGGSPALTRGQMEQVCATARRMRTTIHCVQFGFGPAPDAPFMLELSRRTGGTYRYLQRS